jgi:hypothetical protein
MNIGKTFVVAIAFLGGAATAAPSDPCRPIRER